MTSETSESDDGPRMDATLNDSGGEKLQAIYWVRRCGRDVGFNEATQLVEPPHPTTIAEDLPPERAREFKEGVESLGGDVMIEESA